MTGVPSDLLTPSDFVTLRMGLVDVVGFDAAVLLERVRWRCEVRGGSYVATYADLMAETRLSRNRVMKAVGVLTERGWLVSENAGEGTRTLRWSIVHADDAEETPKVPIRDYPKIPKRDDQSSDTGLCTPYRGPREQTPADAGGAEVVALFPVEAAGGEEWPEAATVAGCRKAWLAAHYESLGAPDPTIKRQALGRIGQVAKDRATLEDWRKLWIACNEAGHAGRWNVAEGLGPVQASRFARTNLHAANAAAALDPAVGALDSLLGHRAVTT